MPSTTVSSNSEATPSLPSQIRERKFFTNNRDVVDLPKLIEVQLDSYRWFLEKGLRELFNEINPIVDYTGKRT